MSKSAKTFIILVLMTLMSLIILNRTTIQEIYVDTIHDVNLNRNVPSCEPKKSIAFLKTHKTGSTTLARIIEHYALVNKLDIVRKAGETAYLHYTNQNFDFNSKKNFLPPKGVMYGDYNNYTYNVFTLHARYDRPVYESFMAKDSIYITLLRNPVTQFESTFDYFKIGSIIGKGKDNMSKTRKLEMFLSNSSYYWEKLSSSKQKRSFNNQIWDLGVDPGECSNELLVNYTIRKLDNEFDFVMITEMFDESLLVLKKKLCWKFHDILYLRRNQRSERISLNEKLRKKIAEWNSIDMKLYAHFKKRLQDHIDNYGPTFEADLAAFRSMISFVYEQCVLTEEVKTPKKKIRYNTKTGNLTSEICKRVDTLDVCDFGDGYILSLDLISVCKDVTSHDAHLNRSIRKMMKGTWPLTSSQTS
ncbi:galactose-3-O-sulfotransferase 2-like isoform X2 [Anneissia japonica]|uniref:galactose-3-O-sulfotransferase 2-like isoform X2 n=1 Tax=Anneissia japonica TaxID=1529436 RepID=UPI001425AD75|nr:galactose-3-O-sulfotransferase 2-like isoform X2 [Anneissia japonica]